MTVEHAKYMDVTNDENEVGCCGGEQNNENLYPLSENLLVAIRPFITNCSLPLITKININEDHDRLEKETLTDSINNGELLDLKKSFRKGDTDCQNREKLNNKSSSRSPILNRKLSLSADSNQFHSTFKKVKDNLSQSCFAELTSEKQTSDIDSELTCLSWLQETNLLKEFTSARKNEYGEEIKFDSHNFERNPDINLEMQSHCKVIDNVDKLLQKPSYSFSTLIFMAIESSPSKRLPVKDIYQWIQDNFPYFQRAPIGWKNSIRHNLSLNKSFKKVDKEKCIGKGSLWMIDHQARAGLVQQLRKTSMCNTYPYSKAPYISKWNRYLVNDSKLHRRDDAEFDVAAAMCSLSSSTLIDQNGFIQSDRFDYVSSEELLQKWRTCFEPNVNNDDLSSSDSNLIKHRCVLEDTKYSMKEFLEEVQNKFSPQKFKDYNLHLATSLNICMDEDYEFDNSDDDSSDDEMRENMLRLVEKERDECLGDSGCSEETRKSATLLDHSYSKSIQSLVRPYNKRETKGVDALLHLANAASRELEILHNSSTMSDFKKDCIDSTNNDEHIDLDLSRCFKTADFTAEELCQQNTSINIPKS